MFKYRGLTSDQTVMFGIKEIQEYLPIVSFDDMINESDNYLNHHKILDSFNSLS